MNWFKKAQFTNAEVIITGVSSEGVYAVCDGKRYFCPGDNGKLRLLKLYIRRGDWPHAKNLLREWGCYQFQQQKVDPQLSLF